MLFFCLFLEYHDHDIVFQGAVFHLGRKHVPETTRTIRGDRFDDGCGTRDAESEDPVQDLYRKNQQDVERVVPTRRSLHRHDHDEHLFRFYIIDRFDRYDVG